MKAMKLLKVKPSNKLLLTLSLKVLKAMMQISQRTVWK
jgi:hypothetical protein